MARRVWAWRDARGTRSPGGRHPHLDAGGRNRVPGGVGGRYPVRPVGADGTVRGAPARRRRPGLRVRIHLCGVRGSTPAPGPEFVRYGGHTSSVALTSDDAPAPVLILDAGTGLRQVTPLLNGAPFRGTILLSHLHWD